MGKEILFVLEVLAIMLVILISICMIVLMSSLIFVDGKKPDKIYDYFYVLFLSSLIGFLVVGLLIIKVSNLQLNFFWLFGQMTLFGQSQKDDKIYKTNLM